MSNAAMTWAWRQPIDNSGAKFVLVALADHASDNAGEDWTCFPSAERLMAFTSQPSRTLERNIAWLEAEGWITRETPRNQRGRMRVRSYVLHRDRVGPRAAAPTDAAPDEASPPANMAGGGDGSPPAKNAVHHPPNSASPPAILAGGYIAEPPEEPLVNPQERAGGRAEAGGREQGLGFDGPDGASGVRVARLLNGYPTVGVEGVSSTKLVLRALKAKADEGQDIGRVIEATLRYGETPSVWGPSKRPCALHKAIEEERYEAFLGEVGGSAGGGAGPGFGLMPQRVSGALWGGPHEVLAELAEAFTPAQLKSYVHPCGWDAAGRRILPRFGAQAAWLRANASELLKSHRITVADAGAAVQAAE